MSKHSQIQDQLANLKPPKVCVTVPLEERESELVLINYAKIRMGDQLTRYDLMNLLESYSKIEQPCGHNCITCKYFKACDQYMGFAEVFNAEMV